MLVLSSFSTREVEVESAALLTAFLLAVFKLEGGRLLLLGTEVELLWLVRLVVLELRLHLLLGMQVREADIINSKLEMFPMLNNHKRVPMRLELIVESCIKLLSVREQGAVTVYSASATQLG